MEKYETTKFLVKSFARTPDICMCGKVISPGDEYLTEILSQRVIFRPYCLKCARETGLKIHGLVKDQAGRNLADNFFDTRTWMYREASQIVYI
jgi:hypothetical protein